MFLFNIINYALMAASRMHKIVYLSAMYFLWVVKFGINTVLEMERIMRGKAEENFLFPMQQEW